MKYHQMTYKNFRLTVSENYKQSELIDLCCAGPRESERFHQVVSSKYAQVYWFEDGNQRFFYKRFLDRNWQEPLKALLRGSRAERAFQGHLMLMKNGFQVPRVVMVGRKKNADFMVSAAITNGVGLNRFFNEKFAPPISAANTILKRQIIRALGRVIGRMHALGICHGDLRWGNILVDVRNGGTIQFILIDNERTTQARKLSLQKRIKNLVQLNMTRKALVTDTDRWRFMQAYLEQNPELKNRREILRQSVLAKTRQRQMSANTRRGR